MMNVPKPLFVFLLFMSFKISYCIQNNKIISCPETEKQSLLSFKQSLQQDPSNLLSSWNDTENNCCKWKGVVCSNLTGHVHQLHLQNSDLIGKINPSLLNLKHLRYLDLSQNNFVETIFPWFIGSMRSLEYLNISGAGFYGHIPQSIGNLSSLRALALEGNPLDVDNLEWLSGLSKLEYLNMNYVNLSKAAEWPEQVINKLPSLVELHLSHCSLNNFIAVLENEIVNNISASDIAIIDLSGNNFQSSAIPKLIFQLRNLIFLDLSSNYIEGRIPSISNTTRLKHVDLSINNFNSSIPEWLYSCKDLEFVSLMGNHLKNPISNSIGNLTSLVTLDLRYNELSGKIPREIGNLCKMKWLDLFNNKLEGELSDSFGNMSDCFLGSLESLTLSHNLLSGNITRQFGDFKILRSLYLGWNSLSGVIPDNIGNLTSLEGLSLQNNKLTGNLPESMWQLLNLKGLYIANNMLQGVVTETHFARLSSLIRLYASGNHLTLSVNPNWTPPFKLQRLRLRSWNLASAYGIPPWLETQKMSIEDLDLSCTGISGNVPSWIWSVRSFNLSHNQLRGNIPIISGPVVGDGTETFMYRFAYLSSNNFSGSLPRVGNNVAELDLSNNSFSGDISHFLCHNSNNGAYKLEILHLWGNLLTGKMPDCWMEWPSLTMLNLGNNDFYGPIPNSIGFLSNLRSLNLYGNRFSGRIPFSMQNCTQLVKLDLTGNAFDGSMPTWFGTNLSKLKFLILRSNNMSGEITLAICRLNSLQILDLSGNKFSGAIPRCVSNFTAMTTKRSLPDETNFQDRFDYSLNSVAFLESASIATKGSKLNYDTTLALVTSIDLSRNSLLGNIPNEITSLVELRSLNLSENHLTGSIPDGIGNMRQLESLDFSTNSLFGDFPMASHLCHI